MTTTHTARQDHPADVYAPIVDAAASHTTGLLDHWHGAYVTDGGTWVLALRGEATDSGRPRDLLAITPGTIDGTRVHPLSMAVDPDMVDARRAALDH